VNIARRQPAPRAVDDHVEPERREVAEVVVCARPADDRVLDPRRAQSASRAEIRSHELRLRSRRLDMRSQSVPARRRHARPSEICTGAVVHDTGDRLDERATSS